MLLNNPPPITKFGRLYAPDPRDRFFPMRASKTLALTRTERFWPTGPVLDQGSMPHCVGYAVHQFLLSAPFMMRKGRSIPGPLDIYIGAQENDEWPGNDYDGTSGRGALKYLKSLGVISEYNFCPDADTMKAFLLTKSGLMVGTEWWSGMSDVHWIEGKNDREAWLEPTGYYQGGHETFWYGYSRKRDAYRLINSWGISWGEKGRAWVDRQVAEHLIFGMDGDAFAAVEVK